MRSVLLHILLLVGLSLPVMAQSDAGGVDYSRYEPNDKMKPFGMDYWSNVGLMQLRDLSGNSEALTICQPLIERWLTDYGLVIRGPEELRPIRRQYRIRSAGQVSRIDAERLRDRLRLDYLVIGSIDIYTGDSLGEVGLSIRVLDLETMELIRAASVATTSLDYGGLFGIGELENMEQLAEHAVKRLFKALDKPIKRDDDKPSHRLAVVPIDNLSEYRQSGEIVSNHLLSRLIMRGHKVVEPGMAYGLFVHNRVMPAGRIALSTLRALRDEYDIDFLMTGSVELFEPGLLAIETAQPRIGLTGRILHGETGKILGATVTASDGDGEALLDIGKEDSLGRLSLEAVDRMIKKLFKQQEQRVAAKK